MGLRGSKGDGRKGNRVTGRL